MAIGTTNGLTVSTTFINSSDDRIKGNEKLIDNACETLSKLRLQMYDKKPSIGNTDSTTWYKAGGLIAQEVYHDCPGLKHLVHRQSEEPLPGIPASMNPKENPDYSSWGEEPASLNYIGLVAYLVKAYNGLRERVKNIRSKMNFKQLLFFGYLNISGNNR